MDLPEVILTSVQLESGFVHSTFLLVYKTVLELLSLGEL